MSTWLDWTSCTHWRSPSPIKSGPSPTSGYNLIQENKQTHLFKFAFIYYICLYCHFIVISSKSKALCPTVIALKHQGMTASHGVCLTHCRSPTGAGIQHFFASHPGRRDDVACHKCAPYPGFLVMARGLSGCFWRSKRKISSTFCTLKL